MSYNLYEFKEKSMIARDMVTGFKGTVIGFCTYTTGCNQYLLAPSVGADGDFKESRWFDEARLQVLEERQDIKNVDLVGDTNGADRPAPSK